MDLLSVDHVCINTVAVLNCRRMFCKPRDLDLVVEVSCIGKNRTRLHQREVAAGDDTAVTGCCDEQISDLCCFVHTHYIKAVKVCLQCPARIDFGDNHACTKCTCLGCNPATAVPVSGNHYMASGKQNVRCQHDRGKSTLAGSMHIVKVMLHRGIVHRDNGEFQLPVSLHCAQTVNTGCGLLACADDLRQHITAVEMYPVDQIHSVVDG